MKVTHEQREKISSYLLDLSKVIMGAILVPLFVPNATNNFHLSFFVIGFGLSMALLLASLKFLPKKQ